MSSVFVIEESSIGVQKYPTMKTAASAIGVTSETVSNAFKRGKPIRIDNKVFHLFKDGGPLDVSKIVWSKPRTAGVKITNPATGACGYFRSSSEAAEALDISESSVRHCAQGLQSYCGTFSLGISLTAEFVEFEHVNYCGLCDGCECKDLKSCKENEDCDVRLVFAKRLRGLE